MMKTVKIVYTGGNKDGLVVGEILCKPGVPVEVPEVIARKSAHCDGLLSRPDFKEFSEPVSKPEPK